MKTDPVILIDMMNLIYRTHWVFQNLQEDGQHTGIQYGVLKTIHDLRANVSSRIVFVWDHGVPVLGAQRPRNWREDVLPTYKANRKHDPEVHKIVVSQLLDLHDIICCLGYSHVSVMGLEADDMIGILSKTMKEEVLIFSTDKDYYQLLDEARIHILVPKKDKGMFRKISQSDVEREHGISVDRWAEYLALGGDGSDNIKPMRGMGPKTAIKLIQNGVDLRGNNEFERQPKEFREKFSKLKEVWNEILKSYHAAQIPTSFKDPRIHSCLVMSEIVTSKENICTQQVWKSQKEKDFAFKKFAMFLADRNMVSLLSIRNKFFETSIQREQTQCPPSKKLSDNKTLI